MAITRDAISSDPTPGTGDRSWTHAGGAGPQAALILIMGTADTDEVTGATYNSVAATQLSGSPWVATTAAEPGIIHAFLVNGISSGSQTVAFTTSGSTIAHLGICVTLDTTANDVETVNTNNFVDSTSQANPSGTLTLSSRTCYVLEGLLTGVAATASITQPAGWSIINETTTGSEAAAAYDYDTIGSSDVTVGWTQAADDAFGVAIALSEVVGGGGGATHPGRFDGWW